MPNVFFEKSGVVVVADAAVVMFCLSVLDHFYVCFMRVENRKYFSFYMCSLFPRTAFRCFCLLKSYCTIFFLFLQKCS